MQQEATGGQKIRPIPIIASFLMAGFIGLFSETALNMALSDLIQVFDISSATVQWLTTGYLLTLGILVPIIGITFTMVYNTRFIFYSSEFFDCWYADCGAFANVCNVNDWACSASSRYGAITTINV